MNILLVGASGYLGNKLLNKLQNDNYNILSLIRNSKSSCIKDYIYIYDKELYDKVNKFNVDFIIYTACSYENSSRDYKDIFQSNLIFPIELLDNIKMKSYIYIGTSLNKFTNKYSLSKYQFAEYGKYYSLNNNINFINIKLENFYGKDEPKNRFLSNIINKLKNNEDINLTEGSQIRDFIYIDDVINGIDIIIKSNLKGYNNIPLGSGEGISIRELVEYLKNILNSKSKLHFGALPSRKNEHSGFADMTKMRDLGFEIKLGIKDSISQYMIDN